MKWLSFSVAVIALSTAVSAVPSRFGRKAPQAARAPIPDLSANAELNTNAKRLAAGLPPLPARKLWTPTNSAKRWATSGSPRIEFKGKVGVKAANGTDLGFISSVLNAAGYYDVDANVTNAASISFSAHQFGKTDKLSLKDEVAAANKSLTPYLGALIAHGVDLSSGSSWKRAGTASSVTVAGTAQSGPDQGPTQLNNTATGTAGSGSSSGGGGSEGSAADDGESAIWSWDSSTNQWTATWQNSDGNSVHTQAYFNPDPATNQTIALVADTKAYLAANPHAVQISLNLVP